jgi:hypothetical protein
MVMDEISAANVAEVARGWAIASTGLPLIIRKTGDGAVVVQALPKARFTKGEFAAALNMSRTKFAQIEEEFGLEPSPSDKMYSADMVETIERLLKQEEKASKVTAKMRQAIL